MKETFYSRYANEFIASTIECDMTEQYQFFLTYLPQTGKILDVGFGSARDMIYFKGLGYDVFGIDIEPKFIEHAKGLGLKALCCSIEDYQTLDSYDGIWACASLLHSTNLKEALDKCYSLLKTNGVLYLSFKYGDFKGLRGERYFIDLTEQSLQAYVTQTKFKILQTKISQDVRENRKNDKWLNVILKKE